MRFLRSSASDASRQSRTRRRRTPPRRARRGPARASPSTGEPVHGRLLAERGLDLHRVEACDLERSQALLDLERACERGLDGHLLVEREPDQQCERIGGQELVRLVAVGEVEPVGGCYSHAEIGSSSARHDGVDVRAPDLLGHRRQDVVPDRGEASDQLRSPRWSGHEPPVQVLTAVAPAADVDATDVADRPDRPLCPRQQDAEFRRAPVGEVSEAPRNAPRGSSMTTTGQSRWPDLESSRQRSLDPDVLVVGGRAPPAVDSALSEARLLLRRPAAGSARGVISPSNGKVSHSSTGGIRGESLTRSYSSSGVSGTGPRCYSGGVARVLLRAETGRGLPDVRPGTAGGDGLRRADPGRGGLGRVSPEGRRPARLLDRDLARAARRGADRARHRGGGRVLA